MKRVAAVAGDTVELLLTGEVAVNHVLPAPPPLRCSVEGGEATASLDAGDRGQETGDRDQGTGDRGDGPGEIDQGTGDRRQVADGRRQQPVARVVPKGELFVLGDCPARSTDSRTWGTLRTDKVVPSSACMHMHICMNAWMHMHMHACTHVRMHACTHAHMHTCTNAHSPSPFT